MKKFLALVMAMMMVLAMGTVAFADEVVIKVDKKWVDENGAEIKDFHPEALKLDVVTKSAENPSNASYATSANIPDITVTMAADSNEFVIGNTDAIEGVGKFTYTMTEHDNGTAGVTDYDVNNVTFTISVVKSYVLDDDGVPTTDIETKVSIFGKTAAGAKVYEIVNKYEDGSLNIVKKVSGNMAEADDVFPVTVTFTSDKPVKTEITEPDASKIAISEWVEGDNGKFTATATLNVKASDTNGYTFTGIPHGVTATVVETDKSCDRGEYDTVTYTVNGSAAEVAQATITNDTENVVITNTWNAGVDTGISMDNAPYMMIMAMVVLAGAAMMMKRRAY